MQKCIWWIIKMSFHDLSVWYPDISFRNKSLFICSCWNKKCHHCIFVKDWSAAEAHNNITLSGEREKKSIVCILD